MQQTIISWTDVTWNPTHGCSKVSSGCANCYAETLSLKYGWTKKDWTKPNEAENVLLKPHKLNEPFKLKRPSKIFVNSMSDLFHSAIPDAYRDQIFDVMRWCPQHIFQILTKRSQSLPGWRGPWLPNIWQGVSIENADNIYRLDDLKKCQAKIKFISFEPLLGPISKINLAGIDWAILGGESGPGFRKMEIEWAREIRDQCVEQGVAFFFKQDAAFRTETRPFLDGFKWAQYPGHFTPPIPV